MAGEILFLGILSLLAYEDWKKQSVPLCGLLLAGAAGLAVRILCGEMNIAEAAAGAGVGALALVLAWATGEAVGAGDGLTLIVSGIFLGFWGVIWLVTTALVLCGLMALFLLVVKRKGRAYRLPFIPFLLAAYLLQLM